MNDLDVRRATLLLRRYTHRRTAELQRGLGFGYRPSEHAPSRYDELRAEFDLCRLAGVPLRVSCLSNDRTVLGPDANLAFRFWHDCTHVALRQDFGHAGEIEVGQQQLAEFAAAGGTPTTTAWRLLFAETIGQTKLMDQIGYFPIDQRQFTFEFLRLGLPEAIEREGQRRRLLLLNTDPNVVLLVPKSERPPDGLQPTRRHRPRGGSNPNGDAA